MMMIGLLLLSAQVGALDCDAPMTQHAMNRCAAMDYQDADRALNEQWDRTAEAMRERDRAMADYPDDRPGHFATLLDGQRAWLQLRDAHCRLEGFDARGGSMEPMLVSGCLARMTEARTRALQRLTVNQISGEPMERDE